MRPLEQMSAEELRREVRKLQALLDEQMSSAPGAGDSLEVHGRVTLEGKPFVHFRSGEVAFQKDPETAREHAHNVMVAAIEAERDAATVIALQEDMGLDVMAAGNFLVAMRDRRAEALRRGRA